MAKFVCPECDSEGTFTEIYMLTYEKSGHFSEFGEIEEDEPDCVESNTDRFICHTCEEEFDTPKKVEE